MVGAACRHGRTFTIYAFAPTATVYFIGMPVFALIGLMQPGLQGLMTRHVSPMEQRRTARARTQSTGGIAAIIGPIFPLTFAFALRTVPDLPGLPMLIAAALLLVAFLMALRAR